MPFCQKCGEAYREGDEFCPRCSVSLHGEVIAQVHAPRVTNNDERFVKLQQYVNQCRSKGQSDTQIYSNLKAAGWREDFITYITPPLQVTPGSPLEPKEREGFIPTGISSGKNLNQMSNTLLTETYNSLLTELGTDAGDLRQHLPQHTRTDIRKKGIQFPYHGSPKKLDRLLHTSLEDLGYYNPETKLETNKTGVGEQLLDIKLVAKAGKRILVKDQITSPKSRIFIPPAALCFLLFGLFYFLKNQQYQVWMYISLILGIAFACLVLKSPRLKEFSYLKGYKYILVDAIGEAYLGTKSDEVRDSGKHTAGGRRLVQTTFMEGDLDLVICGDIHLDYEGTNQELLLKNWGKKESNVIDILSAISKGQKEFTLYDEDKYNALLNNSDAALNDVHQDVLEIKKRLASFSPEA